MYYIYNGQEEEAKYWSDFGYSVYSSTGINSKILYYHPTNQKDQIPELLFEHTQRYHNKSSFELSFLISQSEEFCE